MVAGVVAQRGGEVDGPGPAEYPDHQVAQAGDDVGSAPVRIWEASSARVTSGGSCLLHTSGATAPSDRSRERRSSGCPRGVSRPQRAAIAPVLYESAQPLHPLVAQETHSDQQRIEEPRRCAATHP